MSLATPKNKHGLSRYVPEATKRTIRQECGFGCVICGASIYDYEHINPEFADAQQHDPSAMALLCLACHGKVTRKFWSKEKVRKARSAPFCKASGFTRDHFDFGAEQPEISFAGSTLRRCPIPIQVSGIPVLAIREPETNGAPFRLSAHFSDPKGVTILEITDNQWRAHSNAIWDVTFVGGKISIRDRANSQCLVLRAVPPRGIAVERIKMRVGDVLIVGDENKFSARGDTFIGCLADGAGVGFAF